jgi:hypothetical protein
MSNSLRSFRIFSSEIMKAAAKVDDADVQALLADRKGEEYLKGGKLPSNTAEEIQYERKMAANFNAGYTNAGVGASGGFDLSSKTKKNNKYQKVRDYAASAGKGGLTGLGVLGALNVMRGKFKGPETTHEIRKATRAARNAFVGGAGVATLDKAYRHDELPKMAMVTANPNAAFRSAASSLATSARTGAMKSSVVHHMGKPPRVLQLGQKFRTP